MSLLTPSGGLVYHARSLLYREGAWLPFRDALSAWLEEHLPASEQLILVGPSGGHCLPLSHLRKFARLFVLEPDPLGRALLAARLRPQPFSAEWRDLLLRPLLDGAPGLPALLERLPNATLLFCNVLGQLHFSLSDDEQARFQAEFQRRLWPVLEGRAWASFHDRWSLEGQTSSDVASSLVFPRLPSDDELGAACFGSAAPLTALDHGTTELFPEALPRAYFSWQITPSTLHIVEAVAGR